MKDLLLYLDIVLISLGFTVFAYYVIYRFYLFFTKSQKYKDIYEYHEKHKNLLILGAALIVFGVIASYFTDN